MSESSLMGYVVSAHGMSAVDLLRAFAEVTHEALKRAETAEAELAECQNRVAKLALDLRSAEDRIARQDRSQTDSDRVVKGLREAAATPFRNSGRPHHGPPIRCWCGMTHDAGQATALNAGRDRIEANK